METRTTGATAAGMKKKLNVTETLGSTVYSFRGPRSHRPVEVTVYKGALALNLETLRLAIANARFEVLYRDGADDDVTWWLATHPSRSRNFDIEKNFLDIESGKVVKPIGER